MSKRREELVRTLQDKLEAWNARIDELEVQASLLEAEARTRQQKRIEEIRRKRDELQERVDALGRAGDDARRDLEQGVSMALDALKEAFQSAASRFEGSETSR
jgi:predicted nuclease with TOPRIM domain